MGHIPKWKKVLNDLWFEFRLKMMNSLLKQYGMNWGDYPLEEMTKLYHKYNDEIELT